jgi:hypothetical protein
MNSHRKLVENSNDILSKARMILESRLSESPVIISSRDVSSDETDVKESMAMVFFDCIRTDSTFIDLYDSLIKTPNKDDVKKLKGILSSSKSLGSDYGLSPQGVSNLHKLIIQVLSSPSKNKSDKSFKLVNNGASAANAISTNSKISTYLGSKSYATRGTTFDTIRKKAISLFKDIQVTLAAPDNWCPGDFYLMSSNTVPQMTNVIELNSHFAGPSYPQGDITAISLKMETAQAGKGTTFLNTVLVLSVPEIDKSKTIPTNESSRNGLKYLSTKRVIFKYAVNKEEIDPSKVYGKMSAPFKMIYENLVKKDKIPTIKQFYTIEPSKQKKFLEKYYKKMGKEAALVIPILDKKLLGKDQTKAYADGFKQAYSEFTKYIQDMGIKIQSKGVDEFINSIKSGKASKKQSGVENVLIKKAECYTRAIELIKKWSDKNKEIAKPFKKLGTIDNPLLAITMFAIAQHGANPDFFKVHGSDSGLVGTVELFPAKSKVDKTTIVQSLVIKDSEGAAGFDASYNMKLNNIMYKTTLSFRFSDSSFRVEVQELEESSS